MRTKPRITKRDEAVLVIDGEKVRAMREGLGLSQRDVGLACWPEQANGQVFVSRLERQKRGDLRDLPALVKGLDSLLKSFGDEKGCAPEDLLSSLATVKRRIK